MKCISIFISLACLNFSLQAQTFQHLQDSLLSVRAASRAAAFVDVNNDGWDDLFFTNGPKGGQNNVLYLNQRGRLQQAPDSDVLHDGQPSDGCAWADIDGDEDPDAAVVNWYGADNLLYRNEGKGHFRLLADSPPASDKGFSETAAWLDYDGDGHLDLFVTNSDGDKRNFLYHNDGQGNLSRVDHPVLTQITRASRSVDWVDIDADGLNDIFVTNEDGEGHEWYRQTAIGQYKQITNASLVQAGMKATGSSWADFDNDGDFDLFLAGYATGNYLFRNDAGQMTALAASPVMRDTGCSFGSAWADYDNDGDLDLFVANGFCRGLKQNFLFKNDGTGQLERVDYELPAQDTGWTFGCAWGDLNNDGFLDLAVANCSGENQANAVYLNQGNDHHWIKLHLKGSGANTAAIGAIIRIKTIQDGKEVLQTQRITSQSGYCSQNTFAVHFGLGNADRIEELLIQWPSGKTETRTGLKAGHFYWLEEGTESYSVLRTDGPDDRWYRIATNKK